MKWSMGPVVAALLVLSLGIPVFAQPEVINLTYRLRPGDVLYYQLSRTLQQTTETGTERKVDERTMQAREAIRVLDVDPSGAMVVEWLFEDFRPDAASGTQTQLDTPLWLKLRPDGTVLEVQRGEESPEHALLVLPGRPVAVGESWTWQTTRESKTTFTYTLTRIDQAAGERVAVIRAQANGRSSISPNLGTLPPGVMVRAALLVIRGTGEFHWSIDRGRIVRSTEEVTADATIELANADISVRARSVIKITERRDPLANDVVLVAAPGPEQLIVPGGAVGEWILRTRVGDYTGRYGTPIDRGIRSGFQARVLSWDRGPTVLIDPADADHVVGLEISDRQYRTDKGIGFGSSEGAVLLAHGLTPTRLDVTLPDLGAIRFLIYDDVGVAFAVTMSKSRAAGNGIHAPVGTVAWTIVFAPGDAGKIFQLP